MAGRTVNVRRYVLGQDSDSVEMNDNVASWNEVSE
jgi:hypothetical protein